MELFGQPRIFCAVRSSGWRVAEFGPELGAASLQQRLEEILVKTPQEEYRKMNTELQLLSPYLPWHQSSRG